MAGKTGISRGFSLWDLTQDDGIQHELLEAALLLAEQNGEDQEQAMLTALASVDAMTTDKVCAYGCLILQWDAEAAAIKTEEARLAARRKARENMGERLKARLVELLPHDASFEDARVKLSFRESKRLHVLDAAAIPAQYLVEVPATSRPDALAIKAAIKTGVTVPGAALESNWSVQIR